MPRPSLTGCLRIGCGLLLVAWLLWQAAGSQLLDRLRENPPEPSLLITSWGVVVAATLLSILRWRMVVVSAGIELSFAEAIRLGALGFACNFVALGSVGGDVVKATMLAKSRKGQRAAAVTTIFVDRLFGLLGFLTYASLAILWTGVAMTDEPTPLRLLSRTTLGVAAIAWLVLLIAMAPGRIIERLAGSTSGWPWVGGISDHAAQLAATYHDGRRSLLAALAIGLSMNGVFVLSFYVAARSLPLAIPGVADHFLIVPLTAICGTLPISPNGLGTIEAAAEYLYRALSPEVIVGAGTMAALCHRLAMVATGVTGAAYYALTGNRRIDDAIAQASSEIEIAEGSGTAPEVP